MSSENSFGLTEFQITDMINHDSTLVICDLRKKEDFAKGHIKKSILVKYDEEKILDVPQNSKIVLVSYHEEQAKKMASVLRTHNIEAFFLIGGIKIWTRGLYCTNISYVGTGYP